ncbi:MAG: hypothetical protein ACKOUM_04530, partial [Sphingopyxis sp.]
MNGNARFWAMLGAACLLVSACSNGADQPADKGAGGGTATGTSGGAEISAPQGDARLILAFGDSLYAGYGVTQ